MSLSPNHPFMTRVLPDSFVDAGEEPISRKDEVLLDSVLTWYNEQEARVKTFSDIVNHKNGLSLRIIDWLITNFSKAFSVAIESDGLPRNLCRDYHKHLSAHNKKNFDPFARRRRIHIVMLGAQRRVSTIGQLNFFRWFLSKDLVAFLLQNKLVIEKHMKDSEASQSGRVVKRGPVTKAARTSKAAKTVLSTAKTANKKKAAEAAETLTVAKSLATPATPATPAAAKVAKFGVVEPQLFSGTFRMSF